MTPISIDIDEAARLPIAEITARLREGISSPVVESITQAPDLKTVARWATEKAVPKPDRERKLRFAYQLFLIVSQPSKESARAWFETHNRYLDDTPAHMLQRDLDDIRHDLLHAARAFAGV